MTAEDGRRPRRVFLGLVEIAGYYRNLCESLRGLGVDCTFVDLSGNPFDYKGERQSVGLRVIEGLARRKEAARGLVRAALAAALKVLKVPLFVWALVRFDTFVFGYRSTFLGFHDLRVLRLLRKRVVYCFHGSDVRPPYLDGSVMSAERHLSTAACVTETQRARRVVEAVERYVDAVVSHAPYAHFQRRPFVSFLAVGMPAPTGASASPGRRGNGPLRALHAPSDPAAKGTDDIRAMVAQLRAEGYDLELRELVGQPHEAVLRELATADLVIDQLYSDTPMAGFAAEAAASGVPAVVGGYDSEAIAAEVPEGRVPPTAFCDPSDARKVVARLVDDSNERLRLGAEARAFVTEAWSPAAVAARWLKVLDGTSPAEWLVDPASVRYVHGCGLSEERSRLLISAVVDEAGPEALGVDDKPGLRRALLEFARGEGS
jgi:hypothetical protein